MDDGRFDHLTRALSEASPRRSMLGLLATLPVLGGLFALLDQGETDAKGRRKRRKKKHKHGKGRRRKGKQKNTCKPHPQSKTCLGKCGQVKNNCKKTVDCGSCDCDPPCEECFACQGEPGAPGTCVPATADTPCGTATFCRDGTLFPQGRCNGDGNCLASLEESCDPYTHCTGDGAACATTCQDDNDCVSGSFCNEDNQCVGDGDDGDPCDHGGECASGHCVDAVCCASASCPACQACNVDGDRGACVADPVQEGDPCGSDGQVCLADGACACDASSCPDCTICGVDGACTGCPVCCDIHGVCQDGESDDACGSSGTCEVCPGQEECQNQVCVCDGIICDGACVADGDCCLSTDCANPTPICVDHVCEPCSAQNPCLTCQTCDNGSCVADPSQNRDVCAGAGVDTSICCNGTCCSGCCGADGSCGACLVFVSSTIGNGDLDGLGGADDHCLTLAASLPGGNIPDNYRAWLSDSTASPATRFRHSGEPYILPGGTGQVADDWADLTSGSLNHPIDSDENGANVPFGNILTNTSTSGIATAGNAHCDNWTSASPQLQAAGGTTRSATQPWTELFTNTCNLNVYRTYCFQQS